MLSITLSQLKQYKGFENIANEDGESIISLLYQYSILAYQFFYYSKSGNND